MSPLRQRAGGVTWGHTQSSVVAVAQDTPWSDNHNSCLECYEYFLSYPGMEWHQAVKLVNSMTSRRQKRTVAQARKDCTT